MTTPRWPSAELRAAFPRLYQALDRERRRRPGASIGEIMTGRRAGELLAEMPKHEGGRPEKTSDTKSEVFTPRISDLGIHPRNSSRWQSVAKLPGMS